MLSWPVSWCKLPAWTAEISEAAKVNAGEAGAEPGSQAGASPGAAPEAAGPVVADEELRVRRPDGLRGLAAPLLRGDGNWPSLGLYTSLESRILQGVEGLLASVPFWAQVSCTMFGLGTSAHARRSCDPFQNDFSRSGGCCLV